MNPIKQPTGFILINLNYFALLKYETEVSQQKAIFECFGLSVRGDPQTTTA
mgnify:CR=1 FL=1|jgi:hypothetical protein